MTNDITGYRKLTDEEIYLINMIKGVAEEVKNLIERIGYGNPDPRWLSIGRTDLQTGFMALTRAVARPTTF